MADNTSPLNPERVPAELRHLIPLAERFGLGDDAERDQLIEQTPRKEALAMRRAVLACDDALDEWLAGHEADAGSWSREYLVFTQLRMAADYAEFR